MKTGFIAAILLLPLLIVAGAQTFKPEEPRRTIVEVSPVIVSMHRAYVHWFVRRAGFGIRRVEPPPSESELTQVAADQRALDAASTLEGVPADKPSPRNGAAVDALLLGILPLPALPKPWPPRVVSIDGDDYRITSVQLISLIKHDPPVAYVPPSQPHSEAPTFGMSRGARRGRLVNTSTDVITVRNLNEFEKSALSQISQGANLVQMGNEKVVGAIRAQMSCVDCHDVEAGSLLGAFSYVLVKENAH